MLKRTTKPLIKKSSDRRRLTKSSKNAALREHKTKTVTTIAR